jgi:hypothetical protein
MDIETAATPAGGDDTHAVQPAASDAPAPEAQTPAEGTAPDAGLNALPPEPEEDEFEEIERGEKKYRIPKALKGELLMHEDYTRKTMALADQRREIDQAKAQVDQARQLTTEEFQLAAKHTALSEQIAAYEQVDWDALEAADPVEAQKHWRHYQTALNQRTQTATAFQQRQAARQAQEQRDHAKLREQVETEVARKIPNWTTKRPEVESFAARFGYTPDKLNATADANDYHILYLANEGHKFLERQRAAAKAAAAGAVKPAPEVGGTAAAGADPRAMSMEQYRAWRAANP